MSHKKSRRRLLQLENLGPRINPTLTVTVPLFTNQPLIINGDNFNERVTVRQYADNTIDIFYTSATPGDLEGWYSVVTGNGRIPISLFTGIQINMFSGRDWIDLHSGVNVTRFPNQLSVPLTIPTTIQGGIGNDTIGGGDAADSIDGGAGFDIIFGNAGDDTLLGGTDNDVVSGGFGNDSILGGDGNDVLFGNEDNDTVKGEAGNDVIHGDNKPADGLSNGSDSIEGGAGHDHIFGGGGNDTLFGGTAASDVGSGDDMIFGEVGDDSIKGGDGNDTLYGNTGNDTLLGGDGNDRIFGQLNDDSLIGGNGNDSLDGSSGNDTLVGEAGSDTLIGGLGDDLLAGDAQDGTFIDNLVDHAIDSLGNNTFRRDESLGRGTPTFTVLLDTATNILTINGDAVLNDNIRVSQDATGNITVRTGATFVPISRTGNVDQLAFAPPGTVVGIVVNGNGGNDYVNCSTVSIPCTLNGGAGNDTLRSGSAVDLVNGDAGDDWLYGGLSIDTLNGGFPGERNRGFSQNKPAVPMDANDGNFIFFL
jgi:Ca2+-binding RTX toxin-like protein